MESARTLTSEMCGFLEQGGVEDLCSVPGEHTIYSLPHQVTDGADLLPLEFLAATQPSELECTRTSLSMQVQERAASLT